jgi:two-component system sensor histidine kinase AlgZ
MSRFSPPTADAAATRAPSLWPSTLALADRADPDASGFGGSRFDPLADARADARERARVRAAAGFDVCHAGLALRALLLVQGVLAVATLVVVPLPQGWLAAVGAAAFAGLAGTLLWLVTVCALQRPLRAARAAVRHLAGVVLGAAAAVVAAWPLTLLDPTLAGGPLRTLGLALAGAGLAGLLLLWLDQRARLWQPVDARVRLAELQSRIRPHFLFNALNTALALVRDDPVQAERVLEDLSELFRAALAEQGASVTLDDEVALAQRYLAIEQVRFGPRMTVHWALDPRVGGAQVPPLILQPLVENAVRHGVEPSAAPCEIWIRARRRHGQAEVEVVNTLPDAPSAPGHGIALANVRERLRLLHDVAAQFDTWRDDRTHHARLVLPL